MSYHFNSDFSFLRTVGACIEKSINNRYFLLKEWQVSLFLKPIISSRLRINTIYYVLKEFSENIFTQFRETDSTNRSFLFANFFVHRQNYHENSHSHSTEGDHIVSFTGVSVAQMLRKRTMITGVVYQRHVAEAFANGALNFTQRCTKRLDTFELTLNECNIRYTYVAVLRKLENVKKGGKILEKLNSSASLKVRACVLSSWFDFVCIPWKFRLSFFFILCCCFKVNYFY